MYYPCSHNKGADLRSYCEAARCWVSHDAAHLNFHNTLDMILIDQ